MIKSMTGFGRGEAADERWKITVEMKSVNHRYLDLSIKMPKKLNFFESAIRAYIKKYLERGKVDMFISYEDLSENVTALKYNEALAGEYLKYVSQIADKFSLDNDMTASRLSRYPDVFTMEDTTIDEEEIWAVLEKALDIACAQMTQTRLTEGENLKNDIIGKLDGMVSKVDFIEERSPQIVAEYRTKLEDKVKELLGDTQLDESRIASEVIIFADKICTDEETVRLRSHIDHMRSSLIEGGPIGRKLDFIAQEMNREANTTLSKANDLQVSNVAIDLKTEIEKIREQIQNIE